MSDLTKFSADLDKALAKKMALASAVIRKVGFDGHKNIARETPKDTHRATANWQLDLNGSNEIELDSVAPPDGERDKLRQFKIGDVIHIFNNVSYIIPLEFLGTSQQAPSGWVRSEAIRMESKLKEALRAI